MISHTTKSERVAKEAREGMDLGTTYLDLTTSAIHATRRQPTTFCGCAHGAVVCNLVVKVRRSEVGLGLAGPGKKPLPVVLAAPPAYPTECGEVGYPATTMTKLLAGLISNKSNVIGQRKIYQMADERSPWGTRCSPNCEFGDRTRRSK